MSPVPWESAAGMPESSRQSGYGRLFFSRSLYLGRGLAWLVNLRWIACCGLFFVIWFSDSILGILQDPMPLYLAGACLVVYNALLHLFHDHLASMNTGRIEAVLFAQISADLGVLTYLLYHAGISHNPFVYYYVFHIIITGILLPSFYVWIEASLACVLASGVIIFQQVGIIPEHPLAIAGLTPEQPLLLVGKLAALCTTLLFAAYFTHAVLGQVRRAEQEIRQQDKLLSLGRLVSGIVHQIRNPLDGLKNCLRLFNPVTASSTDCGRYVSLMEQELGHIEQLTERLQDYAVPRPVQIAEVDVNSRVRESIRLLEIGRGGQISITTELADLPPAKADPFAVQEILLNLYRNALDAMSEGGRLTVRTYCENIGSGRMVGIDVIDTGPGISAQDTERVFEAFYSTRNTGEGTGLGLWICRTLATQMGARIKLDSSPGHGAVFTVLLPVAQTDQNRSSGK